MDKLNLNIIIYPFVAILSIFGIVLNKEKIVYKYLAFGLTFLSMIRFDTGYDYYWYYAVSKYQYMHHPIIQGIYKDLEPGIQKIIDLARYYKHPQYFFAITGLITFGLIYYTIYRDSKSPLISLSFFMFLEMGFVMTNSYIMQMTAVSICFFAIKYAYKKEYFKYIGLILIAGLFFHKSALICLIFLFFPKLKIKNYYWVLYLLVLILTLKNILPKLTSIYFPQYFYLIKNTPKFNTKGVKDIIMSCMLSIFIILINLKIKNKNKYDIYLENIFITGSILSFVLLKIYAGHISFRIGIFFIFYFLLLIGNYLEYFKKNCKKKIKVTMILVLNLWILRGIIKSDYIILDKNIGYSKDGRLDVRPNSYGFKIFINKNEADLYQYLPNGVKFIPR
ncbi:MAG: EpsG family protein [Fusobacteriaceae bacterium]